VSTPDDKSLKFSIRKRGPFSTYIHNLNIGEEMTLEGPEGYFSFEEYKDGLIFIGAGIGVAPLISYLRYTLNPKSQILNPKVKVLVSNKTESSTPYLEELKTHDTKFFYTANGGKRIDEESVKNIIGDNQLPIFICGSINFTNDYWKILRNLGIDDERIITEAFF
jgi:predicted ferric reductase